MFNKRIKLLARVARVAMLALLIFSPAPHAMAETYWVSVTAGVDSNDGLSMEQPFASIGKCVEVTVAGDECVIRAGTYRETIDYENTVGSSGTPDKPITFKAYENEIVTVSGADVITPGAGKFESIEWQHHSGNIYRIELPDGWVQDTDNDDIDFSTQVFKNGEMLAEARWPDFANPTTPRRNDYAISVKGEAEGGGSFSYTHPDLQELSQGHGADYFAGARIVLVPGHEWWGRFGTVTSLSGDKVIFSFNNGGSEYEIPAADDPFMLWGTLDFLNTDNEFFIDESSNTLYVFVAKGESPNDAEFSIKRRELVANIMKVSHIRFEGIHFHAGRITTHDDSYSPERYTSHIVFDKIRSKYGTHKMHRGWARAAVELRGTGHTLSNSEITKTASSALTISGHDHSVVNNVIHETGYMPMLSDGIQVSGSRAANTVIANNTVFNTSTLGISFAGLEAGKVIHNRVYNTGWQVTDAAAINSWGGGDGKGTEVAYNMVHDIKGYFSKPDHNGGKGIRLDSGGTRRGNFNFLIHHNLIYNTTSTSLIVWGVPDSADAYNGSSGNILFNNTMDGDMGMNASNMDFFDAVNGSKTSNVVFNGTIVANNLIGGHLSAVNTEVEAVAKGVFNNMAMNASINSPELGLDYQWLGPQWHVMKFSSPMNRNTPIPQILVREPQSHLKMAAPVFTNQDNGDYTLPQGSGAIDAGVYDFLEGLEYTLDASFQNNLSGKAPDLGAFEHGQPPFVAGAVILPEHTSELTVSCEETDEATAACTIENFPVGRYPSADLSLKLGLEGVAAVCTTETDSSSSAVVAHCKPGLDGDIRSLPLFISFDGDEFLLASAPRGDVTCDGATDTTDGIFALRVMVANTTNDMQETCNASGWDVGNNQRVGLEEVIHTLRGQPN